MTTHMERTRNKFAYNPICGARNGATSLTQSLVDCPDCRHIMETRPRSEW